MLKFMIFEIEKNTIVRFISSDMYRQVLVFIVKEGNFRTFDLIFRGY